MVEIQQSSDVTYRLYDYNRKDKNGKLRELHVEKALDVIEVPDTLDHKVINYKDIKGVTNIVSCPQFVCDLIDINEEKELQLPGNTFKMLTVISGNISLDNKELHVGESAVILNDVNKILLTGNGRIIISKP